MWFHPNTTLSTGSRYLGAAEMAAAYQDADLWGPALARCDVIGTYVDPARETSTGTDGFLVGLVKMANLYRKDIAIEAAGPYGTAGYPTGAASATRDLTTSIANIVALGGTVGWISMDHPIQRVIDGLGQTEAQAVAQVVAYMQTIHATYPAIKIGLIDQPTNWEYGGLGRYAAGSYGHNYDTVFTALMVAIAAAGETLGFLHVDIPYEYANGIVSSSQSGADHWLTRVKTMQTVAASYAVPFGVVINSAYGGGGEGTGTFPGAPFAGSDALFGKYTLLFAENLRRRIAAGSLAALDHVLIQSWFYYPRDLAPDTTAYTFCDTFLRAKAVFNTA